MACVHATPRHAPVRKVAKFRAARGVQPGHAMAAAPSIDRSSRTATIALDGDLTIPDAKAFYDSVRGVVRRRDVRRVVLDFRGAQRIDGAGLAIVSLGRKAAKRAGKQFELANVDAKHRGCSSSRSRRRLRTSTPRRR